MDRAYKQQRQKSIMPLTHLKHICIRWVFSLIVNMPAFHIMVPRFDTQL